MLIANPIYDVVFKRMMENDRVAKFFIGTLLEEDIETVEIKPQEFTYIDQFVGLTVFKLDFIATIKTETGEQKKVLIEIQKARMTHDSFIVQVERITDRYQTRLEKLLSLFEQNNFIDEKKIIKEFNHEVDLEELQVTTDILHHAGTNPIERKKIEDEQEAWRSVNAMFEDKERRYVKELEENKKALAEKDQLIAELRRKLGEL